MLLFTFQTTLIFYFDHNFQRNEATKNIYMKKTNLMFSKLSGTKEEDGTKSIIHRGNCKYEVDDYLCHYNCNAEINHFDYGECSLENECVCHLWSDYGKVVFRDPEAKKSITYKDICIYETNSNACKDACTDDEDWEAGECNGLADCICYNFTVPDKDP